MIYEYFELAFVFIFSIVNIIYHVYSTLLILSKNWPVSSFILVLFINDNLFICFLLIFVFIIIFVYYNWILFVYYVQFTFHYFYFISHFVIFY